jgi:hypothetical protein
MTPRELQQRIEQLKDQLDIIWDALEVMHAVQEEAENIVADRDWSGYEETRREALEGR